MFRRKKTDDIVGEISSKYSPKIYEIIRRIVKVESGAVRNHVNLADFFVDLEKLKRLNTFDSKIRRRYRRERTFQS